MKYMIAVLTGMLLTSHVTWAAPFDIPDLDATLAKIAPGKTPDSIGPSPVAGLYQVVFGPQVYYVSKDGKFVVEGDVVDVKHGKNLTEDLRAGGRLKLIDAVDPANMIIFAPEHVKHVVTVFTDVDCPYCRKLHSRMSEYNQYGIEIRYLAFPRTGKNTPSYFKAVSVWCAADRKKAITEAKLGEPVPPRKCASPVDNQLALAGELGVDGTPTLILEDGSIIPGYVAPKKLSDYLDARMPVKE
jgi:thiol:disulfide interchange protein DsbC